MSNCNCEPKTYNIGLGCCQPVLGDIRNYYTKYQIDRMIESATTSGCCITPEEVDDKIASAKTDIESEIPSLSGYATEQWVEDKHYITGVDLSDYATTAYVNTQISSQTGDFVTGEQLSSYTYDKSTIDSKIASGGSFEPSLYYNKTETDNLLDDKLDASAYTPTDLSNYYNKTEVDNKIASAKTEIEGEIPSLDGYATEQWVLDKGYITGVDLSNYATKSEIPTVPTNVSAFNNDAGYLTEHQSLSAYSTTSEVNNLINQSVSGKANSSDVITNIKANPSKGKAAISYTKNGTNTSVDIFEIFGTGLEYDKATKQLSLSGVAMSTAVTQEISESVSGKVDTTTYNTYTASTQTTINSKADSSTLNNYLLKSKIWCGTESEYNSITNKDSETLYLIHE